MILTLPENRGIVNALNIGLAKANGIYIARMDADDIALPQRLAAQVKFMQANKDCVVVASLIEAFTHSPRIEPKELARFNSCYNTGISDAEIRKWLPITNCLCHPSIMFRREIVLTAGGYNREYQYTEDYELFMRLAKLGQLAKLPEILLQYRVHEGQISQEKEEQQRQLDAKIKVKLLREEYCPGEERIVIWGAGHGGQLIAAELNQTGANVLGFIDADKEKHGKVVGNLRIPRRSPHFDKAES